ncbi:MAG TPA: YggT family protein [Pseudomonadales bacterium]|nr:YggT family protein [Pseudomonadales bacterium]
MYPGEALALLINGLGTFYAGVVFTRFMLQLVRADFYNPFSQFMVKATNPVLVPLRRIIPGVRGLDVASLVLMLIVIAIKIALMMMVKYGVILNLPIFFIALVRETASLLISYFSFMIIVMAISSWINPGGYHPVTAVLYQICEPILAPFRKIIPPMGGLDLTPMVVLLLLQAIGTFFGI